MPDLTELHDLIVVSSQGVQLTDDEIKTVGFWDYNRQVKVTTRDSFFCGRQERLAAAKSQMKRQVMKTPGRSVHRRKMRPIGRQVLRSDDQQCRCHWRLEDSTFHQRHLMPLASLKTNSRSYLCRNWAGLGTIGREERLSSYRVCEVNFEYESAVDLK